MSRYRGRIPDGVCFSPNGLGIEMRWLSLLCFFETRANGAEGERDDAPDADERSANEHCKIGHAIEAKEDEKHDEKSVEIAFGDPSESACNGIKHAFDDASFFVPFVLFVFGFETPFEVVMTGNSELDEENVEPRNRNDHKCANGAGDIEVEDGRVFSHEGKIDACFVESMSETEHESDIGDIVGDGIEPFAFMARTHAHARKFAVDAVNHG